MCVFVLRVRPLYPDVPDEHVESSSALPYSPVQVLDTGDITHVSVSEFIMSRCLVHLKSQFILRDFPVSVLILAGEHFSDDYIGIHCRVETTFAC